MSETPEPDRPCQMVLDDAISDTIKRMKQEWAFTSYEVVGVLHVIAARYAHMTIIHEGDE